MVAGKTTEENCKMHITNEWKEIQTNFKIIRRLNNMTDKEVRGKGRGGTWLDTYINVREI